MTKHLLAFGASAVCLEQRCWHNQTLHEEEDKESVDDRTKREMGLIYIKHALLVTGDECAYGM